MPDPQRDLHKDKTELCNSLQELQKCNSPEELLWSSASKANLFLFLANLQFAFAPGTNWRKSALFRPFMSNEGWGRAWEDLHRGPLVTASVQLERPIEPFVSLRFMLNCVLQKEILWNLLNFWVAYFFHLILEQFKRFLVLDEDMLLVVKWTCKPSLRPEKLKRSSNETIKSSKAIREVTK